MAQKFILVAAFLLFALMTPSTAQAALADDLAALSGKWAMIKYQIADKDAKLAEIAKLETRAAAVTAANPRSAEAKIWEAIILATDANITKSLSGLPKVEKAKSLLEQSLKINPRAMDGAANMTLGSMYYQVPGWPVSFGSDEKAEHHLKKALEISPEGLDTNYWYGAFLIDDGRSTEALPYLEKAAAAPIRKERRLADEGRLAEVRAAMVQARKGLKVKSKGNE